MSTTANRSERALRERLESLERALVAIKRGEIDAIVVQGEAGAEIFTLEGADKSYREMVEQMTEGALSCNCDGLILYSNRRFAELVDAPMDLVIGHKLQRFVAAEDAERFQGALLATSHEDRRLRVRLRCRDGRTVRAYLSMRWPPDGGERLSIVVTEIEELATALERVEATVTGFIEALSSVVEEHDAVVAGHHRRVAALSTAIARRLGFEEDRVRGIYLASLVLDVGKIAVPLDILDHSDTLSVAEQMIVQTHATAGYDMLKHIEFPWPIATAVLQHHERLDGSGYPQGLRGDAIIMEASILGVADVVEAMTAHRPYRPAISLAAALGEIESRKGSSYRPEIVDICVDLFQRENFSF